ncbi:MAG: hypothetical protein ACAH59_10670 [Pseudobdellovibrionaceae bacterium]
MLELFSMQKGYNSDIQVKGQMYHVQTEDWGSQNPFLVSRIFCNGAVVKTIKTPHEDALKNGSARTTDAIQSALKQQHNRVLDQLLSGSIR